MNRAAVRTSSNRTLLAALIATVAMLFTAFAAAYLEQRTTRGWQRIALPGLVWTNTAVLLASSVVLEVARRRRSRTWLLATLGLGMLFLAGQFMVWFELRQRGIYLPSTPHSSFVYVMTVLHAVHLLGGLAALAYAAARPAVLGFCAGFWHFLGVIWIYVLGVLVVL